MASIFNKQERKLLNNRLVLLKFRKTQILSIKKKDRTVYQQNDLEEANACIKIIKGWFNQKK